MANTKKNASNATLTNSVNPVNPTLVTQATKVANENKAMLSVEMLTSIAREQLTTLGSLSAIKATDNFNKLVTQFGKDITKAIINQCKALKAEQLNSRYTLVKNEFNDYVKALNSEYNRLKQTNGFEEFTTLIANTWKNAEEFVAQCYPNVINGLPCRKVSYIRENGSYIVECFHCKDLQGKNATSILLDCLANIRKNVAKANKAFKDNEKPTISNAQTDGKIIAAYNTTKVEDARLYVKSDKVTGKAFDTIVANGLKGFVLVSEYRKDNKGKESK